MAFSKDALLDADGVMEDMILNGECDILIRGLTSGSVKLQYKLSPANNINGDGVTTAHDWEDWPVAGEGIWTADTYETVYISEHGPLFRLVGVGNNSGVYVRMARHTNR